MILFSALIHLKIGDYYSFVGDFFLSDLIEAEDDNHKSVVADVSKSFSL